MALSGVRSSCETLARNSDFEPVHLLQLIALLDQRRVALGRARAPGAAARRRRARSRPRWPAGPRRARRNRSPRAVGLDEDDGALGLAAEEHGHDRARRLDDRLARWPARCATAWGRRRRRVARPLAFWPRSAARTRAPPRWSSRMAAARTSGRCQQRASASSSRRLSSSPSCAALSTAVNSAERRISSVRRRTSASRLRLSDSSLAERLAQLARPCALNDAAEQAELVLASGTAMLTSRLPARMSSAPAASARIGSEMRPRDQERGERAEKRRGTPPGRRRCAGPRRAARAPVSATGRRAPGRPPRAAAARRPAPTRWRRRRGAPRSRSAPTESS